MAKITLKKYEPLPNLTVQGNNYQAPKISLAPNVVPRTNISVPTFRGPGTYSWSTPPVIPHTNIGNILAATGQAIARSEVRVAQPLSHVNTGFAPVDIVSHFLAHPPGTTVTKNGDVIPTSPLAKKILGGKVQSYQSEFKQHGGGLPAALAVAASAATDLPVGPAKGAKAAKVAEEAGKVAKVAQEGEVISKGISRAKAAEGVKALQQLENPALVTQKGETVVSQAGVKKLLPEAQRAAAVTPTHEVRSTINLVQAAEKFVKNDPVKARDVFMNGDLWAKTPDAHAKLGQALIKDSVKRGQLDNELLGRSIESATPLGQGLNAVKVNLLPDPEAILTYAAKRADKLGRPLKPETIATLKQMADHVKTLKGAERVKGIQEMKDFVDRPGLASKVGSVLSNILSLPRALMASIDLSGGGRQGLILGTRHPGTFGKAEVSGAKSFVSNKQFEQVLNNARNLTDTQGEYILPLARRAKMALQAFGGKGEEIFGTAQLAEKIPGVKRSERAYSATLVEQRMNAFRDIINQEGGVKAVNKNWSSADFRRVGRVIDTLSGVGHGGKLFNTAAPILGKTLFSAKLWKSRIDLFNPAFYLDVMRTPAARRLILESGGSFLTTMAVILAAATAAGAKVETDPRSSDFAKIKVGNTRYDVGGGTQQSLVFLWRELSGEYKSSTTGKVTDLTAGKFGQANRLTIAARTAENKLNPVLNQVISQIEGKDMGGNPMTPADRAKNVGSLFVPLGIQDTYSVAKDRGSPAAALAAAPSFIGVGMNTYGANTKPGNTLANPNEPVSAPDNFGVADTVKAAMSAAKVNYQGKQVAWNSLNAQTKKQLAATDPNAKAFYDKEQAIKTGLSTPQLHPTGLSAQSAKILDSYNRLTPKGKDAFKNEHPDADYQVKAAQFEADKLAGKFTDEAQLAKAQKSLAKSKVGSSYSQRIRDFYTMTKGDLEKYLATHNDVKSFNQLIAYDDALFNAGLISSHKFRNKYGAITLGPSSTGTYGESSSLSSSSTARIKSVGSPYRYAVSRSAGGSIARPHVSVSKPRVAKANFKKATNPRVTIKKSKV